MIRWSTADIAVIATLLREGKSARQIGKILECSVGAVVGIVHRTPALVDIGFANPQPKQFRKHTNERERIDERLRDRDNGDIIIGRATVRKEKTLMELTSFQCRFPLWGHNDHPTEFLFCAEARVDDSSYCAAHKKLCRATARPYQPQQKGLDPKEQQP